MVTVGLFVRLEAKPGKEKDLKKFLGAALAFAEDEPATTAWFALQFGPGTFGIFDVFPDETGRKAHLTGSVAAALSSVAADLLASPPKIEPVDVLGSKLPLGLSEPN